MSSTPAELCDKFKTCAEKWLMWWIAGASVGSPSQLTLLSRLNDGSLTCAWDASQSAAPRLQLPLSLLHGRNVTLGFLPVDSSVGGLKVSMLE